MKMQTQHTHVCTKCGMIANLDPSMHQERYGHSPQIRIDNKDYIFSFKAFRFIPLQEDKL